LALRKSRSAHLFSIAAYRTNRTAIQVTKTRDLDISILIPSLASGGNIPPSHLQLHIVPISPCYIQHLIFEEKEEEKKF
jgi:hypothetical protein